MRSADAVVVTAIRTPETPPATVAPDVLLDLERHPLTPQAWDSVMRSGCGERWPEGLRATFRRVTAAQALVADLTNEELRQLLDGLGRAGVRALVVKGAALAHSHYTRPYLRPRTDTDLLVDETSRAAVAEVLASRGYRRSHGVEGTLVTQQSQWSRTVAAGVVHAIDVHWRPFNPHLFADVLSVGRVMARAVPVPSLGPHAFAPCNVDALVLACAHRVAHHPGTDDPLWDYDVHLLVSSLRSDEIPDAIRAIGNAKLRAVCAACVGAARARFGTSVPPPLEAFLEKADYAERTATFLATRRLTDVLVSDLAALNGWRARVSLIRQHLFPPPAYLLEKYDRRSRAWLPWLYVRRIVAGLPRWFRSQPS